LSGDCRFEVSNTVQAEHVLHLRENGDLTLFTTTFRLSLSVPG